MSIVPKPDDEVRLNILAALLKYGCVSPNIRQIQKQTGYHKATIKSSIDFLVKEGLVTGFGPKIDFKKFGYRLEVLSFLQADLANKRFLAKFLKEARADPNLYFLSGLVGSGNWNLLARHIYSDIESYHAGVNAKYFEKMPGIHGFIKDQRIFYVTDPFYKSDSRTDSLIHVVRKSRGRD
ncbi:MAG: hypothetical protein HY544_03470 [Candidatus Diapherotrites archaeon]|uniref:Lrp/AsnC family transcriptional regulator n=1 Tax=Candidatus Iainarchaeum sp. TaxID=3101447 RepID=A0A8T3YNG3_9ARCH|nr:hypothetical protein [Candidatus Diapherotrites archaeon]